MSRAEIVTVCTLAAHLAQRTRWIETEGGDNYTENVSEAPQCASDAMALQRLGRSASNNGKRYPVQLYPLMHDTGVIHIQKAVKEVLRPYGMNACVYDTGVHVLGLGESDFII